VEACEYRVVEKLVKENFSERTGETGGTYFIPPRSIRPNLNQFLIKVQSFLVDVFAIEFRGIDVDV
jgi:hypothetical protein